LSSARLPGSIAAEGSPRIGRTAIEKRLRSCTSPQFGSCLENFVIRPKVSGQTLRDAASQISAITEASGVVPQLRERMFSEDQDKTVQCIQACPELFDRDALDWWNRLAVTERTKFLSEASGLLGE